MTFHSTEMVQLTLLTRTSASSPETKSASCHQQGHVDSKTLSSKVL